MAEKGNKVWMYDPEKVFKLSRGGIEKYINCNRCFYIDRKLNIASIKTPPWRLNTAVDSLLKTEFDSYRKKKEPHPYMKETGKNLIPYEHQDLDKWRANFTGVQYLDEDLNLLLYGAVDDVWFDLDNEELIVVDYKATSTQKEITLEDEWKITYKRQLEFYQWALRKNNFKVSDVGYFVYCSGIETRKTFKETMKFDVYILDYQGSTEWIEPTIQDIKKTLDSDTVPKRNEACETCSYVESVSQLANAEK